MGTALPGDPMRSDRDPLLRMQGVTMVYPDGTRALRGVDLSVTKGSIHGLIGANGAGKSTLIKIISGANRMTDGEILWRGESVSWQTPSQAQEAGIATVYQDTPLVDTLTVVENVYVAHRGGAFWKAGEARRRFASLCEHVGYQIDADLPVSELSIGERQMVAIMQGVSREPELLILDEPTASLSRDEREVVAQVMRTLAGHGVCVVFVSHLLDEVLALTDALTVLLDGRVTLERTTEGITEAELVSAIIGDSRILASESSRKPFAERVTSAQPILRVAGLHSPGRVHATDLEIAAGEIVGVAGLLGSGRSELLHAIFGSDSAARGTVELDGRRVGRSPVDSVRAGIALVPEDRQRQALLRDWEIWRNVTLPHLPAVSWKRFFPQRQSEHARALSAIRTLSIKAASDETPVSGLSGGNAQKVVLGRWLSPGVRVLLLDEPTVGIDVGAKADVRHFIERQADEGRGVLIVDSEFTELMAICDRIIVINRGRVVAERRTAETSVDELVSLASGLTAPLVSGEGGHSHVG